MKPSSHYEFSLISRTFFIFFLFLFFFYPSHSFAQNKDLADQKKEIIQTELFQIIQKTHSVKQALTELNKSIPTRETLERIAQLQIELNHLDANFEARSTQLSQNEINFKKKSEDNWLGKVQAMTKPIINILHRLSEKPRKIDTLQEEIEILERKISKSSTANKSLKAMSEIPENLATQNANQLQKYRDRFEELKIKYNPQILKLELDAARGNLQKLEGNKKTLLDLTSELIEEFFSVRGKNILFALGAFLGVWWALNKLGKLLINRSQFGKAFKTAYGFLTITACIGSSVLVLFLRNDWLLLSVVSLILLAVFWTSRQIIPQFFNELKMIMNLGPVKEGERIIWEGLPWLVKEVGMQTTIENKNLENGIFSVPISYLIDLHSRSVVEDEPWFPTKKGNWVLLSDKTYGQILFQTIEQVVVLSEGSKKFYPTQEFLNLNPINLSTGFDLFIEFGLNHSVQEKIPDEIPQLFESEIQKQFKERIEKKPADFNELNVMFSEITPTSLNLTIIVKVDGRLANEYYIIRKEINSALVRVCNANGFAIPSNQITIDFPQDGASANQPSIKN
jgi:small-conductance mechanosensitive channel